MRDYTAIVIGATGAVGSSLVRELLQSPRCSAVTIVTRRGVDLFGASPKLRECVLAMERLDADVADLARGCDAAFCTMGIGQPSKATKEEFWRVDVEYASAFGRACRAAGVPHFSLLTSADANANARIHYLRVKGAIEDRILALQFARTSLFRPSLLVTKETRYGIKDVVMQNAFPKISWMLPSRWREISVEDLGRAMRLNAEQPGQGTEILHYADYMRLLQASSS